MSLFFEFAWKSGIVGVGGLLLLALLRTASARLRHIICAVLIALIAILPGVCLVTRVLPARLVVALPRPTLAPQSSVVTQVVPVQSVTATSPPQPLPLRRPATTETLWYESAWLWLGVWALGFLACALPWLASLGQLRRWGQDLQAPSAQVERLASTLGGGQRFQLGFSHTASVPMTWGTWHPTVVLPDAAQAWTDAQVVTALRHELVHVRRRDFLTQNFAQLVCAVYWFHPLVWGLAARLRLEAEAACDAQVVAEGMAAPEYATQLLNIAQTAGRTPVPLAASAIARTSALEGRIDMILQLTTQPNRISRRQAALALCGLLGMVALVGTRIEARQEILPPGGQPSAPLSDPDAVEFLKQSMDTYAALTTFQADADWWLTFPKVSGEGAPSEPATTTRTIAYVAPNRFRITNTVYQRLIHTYVSDGSKMVILKQGYNQASERFSAPASLAVADANNMSHPHFGGSALYRFFAGRDGYEHLLDAKTAWDIRKHKPQAVRFGPDVTVDGEPCKTVIFGGGLYYDEQRAIISTRDHLVRRLESFEAGRTYTPTEITERKKSLDLSKMRGAQRAAMVKHMQETRSPDALTVESYKNIRTNVSIDDSTFAIPKSN